MHGDAIDTLGNNGVWVDPLWRVEVALTATEKRLLRTWPVRRLAFVAHAGAASITTVQTYSRLEHSLGVLALVSHFAPGDLAARTAALLHDVGHLPFNHTLEGLAGLDHHDFTRQRSYLDLPTSQGSPVSDQRVDDLRRGLPMWVSARRAAAHPALVGAPEEQRSGAARVADGTHG